jgi:hypothetical protein
MMKKRYCASALLLAALPASGFAAETITYTYDAQGRLIEVDHSGTVNAGIQTTYTHDDADNRSNVTTTGVT